jgi:inosine-uridine nucleoside N-ribohydrolase
MTMRFWILAALAAASPAVAAARETAPKDVTAKTLVFFDNDFLGPGQSNIQALIPLLRNPQVDVIGLGVVTGDQWATEATAHALRFLEIAKRTDVPVHTGASMPLIRDQAEMKAWETRFGVVPFKGAWNAPRPGRTYHPDQPDLIPPMPEGAPKTLAARTDAVQALIAAVRAHPGQVVVIAAGPLTNIAMAIRIAPDLPKLAKEIVLEGGRIDSQIDRITGNADYATDFNFLFDPEAAHIVLTAPWQRITVLENVTSQAKMTPDVVDRIDAKSPVGAYVREYARRNQPMWDELVTAVAVDRTLVTKEVVARMDVDLAQGASYGRAQVWSEAMAPKQGEQPVHIVLSVDADRFIQAFVVQASK